MRKTFLYFCKHVVQLMPRDYFKEHFLKSYIELSKDNVSNVRRLCASVSLSIRPYFKLDVDLSLELMELVNRLSSDPDHDVLEAAEQADYLLC